MRVSTNSCAEPIFRRALTGKRWEFPIPCRFPKRPGIRVTIPNPFQNGPMEPDRNLTRAYRFSAHAELTVEVSGTHYTAHLYELSREHCRLQMVSPPPVGTAVLVNIYAWPHFFEVHGTVSQSDPNLVSP
jgi:hypothetical protein